MQWLRLIVILATGSDPGRRKAGIETMPFAALTSMLSTNLVRRPWSDQM
jgi:hypothetical protein